jgi:hypothetical protein
MRDDEPRPVWMSLPITHCWVFIFKVTEPNSIPYRTHSACAKRAAYPDPLELSELECLFFDSSLYKDASVNLVNGAW